MVKGLSPNQLEAIRRDTNKIVHTYDLFQFDPEEALDKGVGNCFSKAIIASGLIALRYEVEPSLIYKQSVHGSKDPTIDKPKDQKTGRNIAHVSLVVPSPNPSVDRTFPGLHFGIAVYQGKNSTNRDPGEVMRTYNMPDTYVEMDGQGIVRATELAREYGMYAGPWRDVAPKYLEALERPSFNTERFLGRLASGNR